MCGHHVCLLEAPSPIEARNRNIVIKRCKDTVIDISTRSSGSMKEGGIELLCVFEWSPE